MLKTHSLIGIMVHVDIGILWPITIGLVSRQVDTVATIFCWSQSDDNNKPYCEQTAQKLQPYCDKKYKYLKTICSTYRQGFSLRHDWWKSPYFIRRTPCGKDMSIYQAKLLAIWLGARNHGKISFATF